jgi:biopolymer transport protein ExbB
MLATISGAGPNDRFLGTVVGMIQAFHKSGGQIEVEHFQKGLYTAMTTTVVGLVVGNSCLRGLQSLSCKKTDKIVNGSQCG